MGKTTAALDNIAANQNLTNHLYVAPSIDLVNQTLQGLASRKVAATAITSETHPKRVKGEIIRHLTSAPDCGFVLLITWSAFIDLPYFHRPDNWTIIVDEVPKIDSFCRLTLPHNYGFLADQLEPIAIDNGALALVTAKNPDLLKRLLDSEPDDVHELFRPLFRDVLSTQKHVYVDRESWDRIVEHQAISKQNEHNSIYFLSMLKPEALLGTILLGANVEDSLLYHWFQQQGVRFEPETAISGKLRPSPGKWGERLHISYFVQGRNFSKYLAKQETTKGGFLVDQMDAMAVEELAGEPFLYVSNNDRESEILANAPNGKKISVVSNGLNTLQGYHNIYFSAALNRQPKHFAMLKALGLLPDLVHRATAHEAVYQVALRTSLRDHNSTHKVHAIVPDQATAERLGSIMGCRDIAQIGNLLPPPIRPLSKTDKSRRYQFARLKHNIFVPKTIPRSSITGGGMDSGTFPNQGANLSCTVTFHKDPYGKEADDFKKHELAIHDFVAWLSTMAKTPINSKDEMFLWNPTHFEQRPGENGYRRQATFVKSSFLGLDFDNGGLSPEALEDIFWKKAKRGKKHSFIVCNSFSRSPEAPNRFRAIFFYQSPVQSVEAHQAVYAYIVSRLEECGHTAESSQLDPNCKSGIQSFWMPCTNRAHPEFAFFRTYGTKKRDLDRCAIDPGLCLREQEVNKVPTPKQVWVKECDFHGEIETLKAKLGAMTCNRHKPFFDYGILLAQAGLGRGEIEWKLREIAGNECKLRKKIPGVLKSLSRYGWI